MLNVFSLFNSKLIAEYKHEKTHIAVGSVTLNSFILTLYIVTNKKYNTCYTRKCNGGKIIAINITFPHNNCLKLVVNPLCLIFSL